MAPSFNPKFTFDRRTSRDISSSRVSHDERQPLLLPKLSNGEVERNVEPPQIDVSELKFLREDQKHDLQIYANIHRIRREIVIAIDDPYSYDQLRGNRMSKTVVRPLVDKFYDPKDISIVFCLMVNRVRFAKEETTARHQSISHSRSILCELLAIKILRRISEEYHGPEGLLILAHTLVTGFDTFQNAPFEIAEEHSKAHQWLEHGKIESDRKLTALEIAIVSNSKNFLSTRPCQRVIDAIYQGTIVYTPTAFFEFLPDRYKFKSIGLYNAREAPLLDQYRLVVPRNRYYLEIWHFVILLGLYVAQMQMRDRNNFTFIEGVFCVYTFGWLLDQSATIFEHGWQVYTQNLWTYLDVSFGTTFILYFILRLVGHSTDDTNLTVIAFDLLAMGAPFLVPRLAFNLLSENMLFVSLREMMSNFILLTLLAVWSFGGFLMACSWMARGEQSPLTIAKWMLWLWFGLDATGIENSPQFHWLLGPVLMISFAFLGNTLFLTILVSMLSNTFSTIAANPEAEIQYRRTVITFEGVKSDALFSFPPPFNILALIILLPLKMLLTPRYFHKVIVCSVRTVNLPVLLIIAFWERRNLWFLQLPPWYHTLVSNWQWDNLGLAVHGDLHTVFERAPPRSVYGSMSGSIDLGPKNDIHEHHLRVPSLHPDLEHLAELTEPAARKDSMNIFRQGSRKESVGPYHEVTEQLHELFQEHGGGRENTARFEHIEASIVRMEDIFAKFCSRLQYIEEDRAGSPDRQAQQVDSGWLNGNGGDSRRGSKALETLARRMSAQETTNTRRRSTARTWAEDEEDEPPTAASAAAERRRSSVNPIGAELGRRGSQQPGEHQDDRRGSTTGISDIPETAEDDEDNSAAPRRESHAFNSFSLVDSRRGSQHHRPGDYPDTRRASTAAGETDEEDTAISRRESHRFHAFSMTGDRRRSTADIEEDQFAGFSRPRERESLAFIYDDNDDQEVCPIDTTRGSSRRLSRQEDNKH